MSLLSYDWNLYSSNRKSPLPKSCTTEWTPVDTKNHFCTVKVLRKSVRWSGRLRCAGYKLKLIGLRLATDDIRLTGPIIFRSMSSSDFPCVSGTHKTTNTRPTTQTHPKNQKVP